MKYWNTFTFYTKIYSDEQLLRERSSALYYFFEKYPNAKDISLWCEWKEDPYYAIFLAGVGAEKWLQGHILKNFYKEVLKSFPYKRDDVIWIVDGLYLMDRKYSKTAKKFELKFYSVHRFLKRLKFKLTKGISSLHF